MERFFTAANAASLGKNIEEFRSLFSDSCGVCAIQFANFDRAYSSGQSATGTLYEEWEMTAASVDEDQVLVTTVVNTGEIRLLDRSGETIETFPAEEGISTVWTLTATQEGWLILDAQDLP